jgi:hypothetical protein
MILRLKERFFKWLVLRFKTFLPVAPDRRLIHLRLGAASDAMDHAIFRF